MPVVDYMASRVNTGNIYFSYYHCLDYRGDTGRGICMTINFSEEELCEANFIDALPFIERKRAMRAWLKKLQARLVCSYCGDSKIEFHHVGKKTMKINLMVRKACHMKGLIDELKLTMPLCHSCHVIETRRMKNGKAIKSA